MRTPKRLSEQHAMLLISRSISLSDYIQYEVVVGKVPLFVDCGFVDIALSLFSLPMIVFSRLRHHTHHDADPPYHLSTYRTKISPLMMRLQCVGGCAHI